jgi:peptide/nickel transport system permease protein
MANYVARRLLALVPTMFFASLIVFFTIRMIPGDVIDLMLAQNDVASSQDKDTLRAALGLDQPIWRQYLDWAGAAAAGRPRQLLWQNASVSGSHPQRLPVTLELGVLACSSPFRWGSPSAFLGRATRTPRRLRARSFSLLMLRAGLLARHPGHGLSLRLVALVAGAGVRAVVRGPLA